ncbi:hypothetical protein BL250_09645 [Erwinia sp. OLTSP20]|uniref:LPS translocon maturation chaperone LptM n=1 Tax=unclassified Erwinia TaxID=2622719 RepID=UPI000C1A5ED6|nr:MULTISPECIES: lipoprotein [unclassified Erwinia]PIJ50780.1 hypothetical protein BV501_07325 [Erwinia sp. OAMSP11]PIJ72932.1 hypothetical protein BK416_07950 [Erwinia sp. OLSSP12]PIJ81947.1 hypothetical protein BLD47_07670 [Erwinia sp. OLCASP19]PIJ84602.1 hypothetical protein BLD46_07760 [Erwinia sp. OLMTSP26]PIJ86949.1 hypothetical protein BLD49_07530 [Erwinia sp. OLMDSP33]
MKTTMCRVAMAAALFSLAGCGLKGPLYFPAEKQPVQPQQPAAKNAAAQRSAGTTTGGGVDNKASQ